MDRTTKILLAAIALGLWANAAATIIPNVSRSAVAQSNLSLAPPTNRRGYAGNLEDAVLAVANGFCTNEKLC